MKKTLVLIAILTLASWTASHALIGIGVRAGLGSYGTSDQTIRTASGMDSTIAGTSESGLLFGAHVDFTALPMIGLEASATYWPKSKTISGAGSLYKQKYTYSVIALDGTAKYKISIPGSPLTPYIGAGPGLYMSKTKVEWTPLNPGVPNSESSTSKFGIHGAVGANLKLPTMPVSFGAQAKYSYILSDPKSRLLSIVGLMTYNF